MNRKSITSIVVAVIAAAVVAIISSNAIVIPVKRSKAAFQMLRKVVLSRWSK